MLAEIEETVAEEEKEMLSLNHSVICLRILRQLIENPTIEPLPDSLWILIKALRLTSAFIRKQRFNRTFAAT